MSEWVDGEWVDGWVGGWIDGWMDGWEIKQPPVTSMVLFSQTPL